MEKTKKAKLNKDDLDHKQSHEIYDKSRDSIKEKSEGRGRGKEKNTEVEWQNRYNRMNAEEQEII